MACLRLDRLLPLLFLPTALLAQETVPDYLAWDWNPMTAELWRRCRQGIFRVQELEEGLRSDRPLVRANALLAWYSLTVLRGYWLRVDDPPVDPKAPLDLISDQDLDVWGIVFEHFADDDRPNNLQAARRAVAGRPAVSCWLLRQCRGCDDEQLLDEVVALYLDDNYNEFRPELTDLILGRIRVFSGNRPRLRLAGSSYRGMYSTTHQEWLVHHGEDLYPVLAEWLQGEDSERQAIAAYVFARRRWRGFDDQVCAALIPHLADDDRRGNAFLAANALLRLGDRALPRLRAARGRFDDQADLFIDLLILDITDPPTTRAELERRRYLKPSLAAICPACFDPLLQHRGPDYYFDRPVVCLIRPLFERTGIGYHSCSPGNQPWNLVASACPCKSSLCSTKERELTEPASGPPVLCTNQDLDLLLDLYPELDLAAMEKKWPEEMALLRRRRGR